jgi:phosphoribosyl isomerase A
VAGRCAEWIHLVDPRRRVQPWLEPQLLAAVVDKIDISVELSGGIHDDASFDAALATGCARLNNGTAALKEAVEPGPEQFRHALPAIVDALDCPMGNAAAVGWARSRCTGTPTAGGSRSPPRCPRCCCPAGWTRRCWPT